MKNVKLTRNEKIGMTIRNGNSKLRLENFKSGMDKKIPAGFMRQGLGEENEKILV